MAFGQIKDLGGIQGKTEAVKRFLFETEKDECLDSETQKMFVCLFVSSKPQFVKKGL